MGDSGDPRRLPAYIDQALLAKMMDGLIFRMVKMREKQPQDLIDLPQVERRQGYTVIERRSPAAIEMSQSLLGTAFHTETKTMAVKDERDAFTNEQKQHRGDFIHGANWMAKWFRENNPTIIRGGGYGSSVNVQYPSPEAIAQAAKERYPIHEEQPNVQEIRLANGHKRYVRLVNGEARFFLDVDTTQPASVPPLTPDVVAKMALVASQPTITVTI